MIPESMRCNQAADNLWRALQGLAYQDRAGPRNLPPSSPLSLEGQLLPLCRRQSLDLLITRVLFATRLRIIGHNAGIFGLKKIMCKYHEARLQDLLLPLTVLGGAGEGETLPISHDEFFLVLSHQKIVSCQATAVPSHPPRLRLTVSNIFCKRPGEGT